MSAHRSPRWSPSEIAILREHYPRGGIKAVVELLPGRSVHSIQVRLSRLGIKCGRVMCDAPKCVLTGDDLEEAIRLRESGWSFLRIGARFNVAESSACNAVLNALCVRRGFTPAERDERGRLTDRGMERLRWMLKKGFKGVEIQLRLAVSASCVAEQRRRYNRELKAKGKALLPPPGGGTRYSGVKLTREQKARVEQLFLDGYGTANVARMAGVSKTSCTRIRNRLIARLKRRGEALPGCDANGKRRAIRDHARHVPEEMKEKLRELILARVPVKRAAESIGLGLSSAYRLRDEMVADGFAIPKPRLPGRVRGLRRELLNAQKIPPEHMMRFRALVRKCGDTDEARRRLRVEIAAAKRNLSFEEKLKLVADGKAQIVPVQRIVPVGPDITLGGVATGAIF